MLKKPRKRTKKPCKYCKYLGVYQGYKLYWCKVNEIDTVNLVYGDTGPVNGYVYHGYFYHDLDGDEFELLYLCALRLATKKGYIRLWESLNED